MILYLVRHAHAVSDAEESSRPLSARGVEQMERVADFLKQSGVFRPAQLWHSPLRRARETAEILARSLGDDSALIETGDLLPEGPPAETAARLGALISQQPLALVGHEPHLSQLATLLVQGRPTPESFVFKKGAVLALERSVQLHKKSGAPRWVVAWHLSPELISFRAGAPASR